MNIEARMANPIISLGAASNDMVTLSCDNIAILGDQQDSATFAACGVAIGPNDAVLVAVPSEAQAE